MEISAINHPVRLKRLKSYIKKLDGLVAYYPLLEESGTIAVNHAPDTFGTLNGTVTGATQGVQGKVGKAYSFDGINDTVDVNDSANLRITGDLTLLLFVNLDDYTNYSSLINKFTNDNNCEYHWRVQQTSGVMYLQQGSGAGQLNYTSGVEVGTGSYKVISVTKDSSNVIFYNNGVGESPQNTSATEVVTTNAGVRFGARNDNNLYLKGDAQHAAIFNRALSAAEQLRIAKIAGVV